MKLEALMELETETRRLADIAEKNFSSLDVKEVQHVMRKVANYMADQIPPPVKKVMVPEESLPVKKVTKGAAVLKGEPAKDDKSA